MIEPILLNLREAKKIVGSIATGAKVPCSICGEPLIAVRAKNGDLVGAKCPKATFDHDWIPWRYGKTGDKTGDDIRELIKSVETGKKVPCSACGEALVIARSGGSLGAKCPKATFDHDWINLPYGKGKTGARKLMELIRAGKKVPCLVCEEPLIVVRINEGVTCPHSHMFYPLIVE